MATEPTNSEEPAQEPELDQSYQSREQQVRPRTVKRSRPNSKPATTPTMFCPLFSLNTMCPNGPGFHDVLQWARSSTKSVRCPASSTMFCTLPSLIKSPNEPGHARQNYQPNPVPLYQCGLPHHSHPAMEPTKTPQLSLHSLLWFLPLFSFPYLPYWNFSFLYIFTQLIQQLLHHVQHQTKTRPNRCPNKPRQSTVFILLLTLATCSNCPSGTINQSLDVSQAQQLSLPQDQQLLHHVGVSPAGHHSQHHDDIRRAVLRLRLVQASGRPGNKFSSRMPFLHLLFKKEEPREQEGERKLKNGNVRPLFGLTDKSNPQPGGAVQLCSCSRPTRQPRNI